MAVPEGYERVSDPNQREAEFTASANFRSELRSIIAASDDLREMDASVRDLLDRSENVPAFEREQIAATYMLEMELTKGNPRISDSKADVVGHYLGMLLEHENPDAQLVSTSLDLLKGHWNESEIQDAAQVTFGAAEKLLESQASCDDCGIDRAIQQVSDRSGLTHNASAVNIYNGAVALREQLR